MKPVRLLAFALMLALGMIALSTPAQASNTSQNGTNRAPAAGCMPGTVASSPNVLGSNELFGIEAISANDMWAVGSYYSPTNGSLLTLTEHFDGANWAQVPSPNGPGTLSQLNAVSAVSANDVWAVGHYGDFAPAATLTMHWDGSAWSIVPSPNPGPTYFRQGLNGVVAISSNDVWAVGYYSAHDTGYLRALIIHWNGTTWTQVPLQGEPINMVLYGVTALSSNDVWAVGGYPDSPYTPLVLHWDGSVWSQVSAPGLSTLTAVDAVSASDVWAVGYTEQNQTLTMHWDGASWAVVPSQNPVPTYKNQFYGVSALAADDVWAVGLTGPNSISSDYVAFETLIEHWDGTTWSVVDNSEAESGKLYAVDALFATSVTAVGGQINPRTLVEEWDGDQWHVFTSPSPGLANNGLNGVDALSPTDIWAVGTYDVYGPRANQQNTLVQHWDGYTWTTIPSPNGLNNENLLNSVDAISANDVWAVGMSGDGGDFWTLTMHWDGTAWTNVPSPNPGDHPRYLQSVSAASTNDVWAVGLLFNDPSQTFIIHWDGSAWSVVTSPNVGTESSYLYGVTAISADDAWAVGYYASDTIGMYQPLFLHWDGSTWAHVPGPVMSNAILSGVSAVSSDDVWAVGTDYSSSGETLTMHWDGSAWSVVPSPSFGSSFNRLSSVSSVSADNVWAAGDFKGGTLIEQWDGSQWSITYISTPGLLDNYLLGISALSGNDVWAVGHYSDGAPSHTLVEHIGRFSDVTPGDYFFTPVNYLVEQGAVSGYDDCTFRPGNDTTRGQLSKIVTLAQGWSLVDPSSPTFADVAPGSTFYQYIETMYARGLISGYPCGDPGEPCDGENRPYFRPNAQVTRGQITKIVVLAKGWALKDPANPTFADVESGSTFYTYVETASAHGIINGYECGGPSEPCDGENRPYFRPGFSATRGQIAKIVYNAVTQP